MGAWDASVFGNDTAADWAGDLIDAGSVDSIVELLSQVAETPEDDVLDADLACEALAAAEVVAAAAGSPVEADEYNAEALAWGSKHPELGTKENRVLAVLAAERVRAPGSELLEHWRGIDPEPGEWDEAIDDLVERLS
ncbi:DUF4259 domain-containing protein [Kribbella deserti]|uniref:DUF4259 domain-containing protein n=1 Tax=Kribbella deserti TaxID=1926257 RepID=A0ABV6QHG5_9ACTN